MSDVFKTNTYTIRDASSTRERLRKHLKLNDHKRLNRKIDILTRCGEH